MGLTRLKRDEMVRELEGLASDWDEGTARVLREYELPLLPPEVRPRVEALLDAHQPAEAAEVLRGLTFRLQKFMDWSPAWVLGLTAVIGGVVAWRSCGGSEDPLMKAVGTDDRATVERLLAAGANVNEDFATRDHNSKGGWWPDGSTPLMAAVCLDPSKTVDDKMVDLLIAKGARVNQKASVIYWRVQWNKWTQQRRDGWTPLLCAAAYGRYYTVKDLVDHHADVNVHTQSGLSPLHYAAALDKKGIVKVLLAAKANVDAADSDGDTALHLAAHRGYADIVPLLVAAHADVNARNKKNRTPLDVAKSEDMRVALRKAGGKRAP